MVAGILSKAGCVVLYVDGSFVTGKPHPNDFDVCWDPAGVRSIDLPAVLLDTRNRRGQKSIFRGDVVPMDNPGGGTFLDLFQVDKESGLRKGIIGIKLAPPAEVTRVVHA